MHFLNLIQLCFSVFALKIDGYVLLAANLDDFRSIAKRFVPEKLAEQLVEMASESTNADNVDPKVLRSGEVYYAETDEKTIDTYEEHDSINKNGEEVKKPEVEVKKHGYEVKVHVDESRKPDTEAKKPVYEARTPDNEANKPDNEANKPVYEARKPDYDAKRPADNVNKRGMIKEMPNIDIDEIVEKVKERLEKEYILKLSNAENVKIKPADKKTSTKYENNDSGSRYDTDDDDKKPIRNIDSTQYIVTDRFTRESRYKYTTQQYSDTARDPDRERTPKKTKTTQNDYVNDEREANTEEEVYKPATEQETMLFDAVDMMKSNDSYEDYVTPKKYQIFESKETHPERYNVKAKTDSKKEISQQQKPNVKHKASTDYDYEIKARTENLNFEERDFQREEIKNVTVKGSKSVTKKVKAGTMIPTRQYYKISSPNYYAKLPIIAEKYDFNEPIPERDREREDLRSIGNPPASINKKVKLL